MWDLDVMSFSNFSVLSSGQSIQDSKTNNRAPVGGLNPSQARAPRRHTPLTYTFPKAPQKDLGHGKHCKIYVELLLLPISCRFSRTTRSWHLYLYTCKKTPPLIPHTASLVISSNTAADLRGQIIDENSYFLSIF